MSVKETTMRIENNWSIRLTDNESEPAIIEPEIKTGKQLASFIDYLGDRPQGDALEVDGAVLHGLYVDGVYFHCRLRLALQEAAQRCGGEVLESESKDSGSYVGIVFPENSRPLIIWETTNDAYACPDHEDFYNFQIRLADCLDGHDIEYVINEAIRRNGDMHVYLSLDGADAMLIDESARHWLDEKFEPSLGYIHTAKGENPIRRCDVQHERSGTSILLAVDSTVQI